MTFTETIPFLTFQQRRILTEHELDMNLWQSVRLADLWQMPENVTKSSVNREYDRVIKVINKLRNSPSDYRSFNPEYDFSGRNIEIVTDFKAPDTIMGRCPCPSEDPVLRCCNLKTLDAVQQCAFACAYCSIQSFYSCGKIKVISDLDRKLKTLNPDKMVWHIGTGQSSDSLLLGNDYGTLSALFAFAESHPDIVIELKTKSARTDWLGMKIPANVVVTWSVNADTVVRKEEHLTANLDARIDAASKCAENGCLTGFHVHPMVWFTDWKKEYSELVKKLCDRINPDNAVMVGIGTLTFTKQNLKTLRQSGRPTMVTKMPLSPVAGKYSYSDDVKKMMFSYLFSLFPQDWKDRVFFYLCMENRDLWQPCLGRSYESNDEFEKDMKQHYMAKVRTNRN
ncbi:MAG: DNA photolyase [Sphaerochaetaceae bacterium]|nr:DNA photolyase [Sphaerochaetaceae bacterium]